MKLWDFFIGGIDTILMAASEGVCLKCQWSDKEVKHNLTHYWGISKLEEAG